MKAYGDILAQIESVSSGFTNNIGLVKTTLQVLKIENRDLTRLPIDLYYSYELLSSGFKLDESKLLIEEVANAGSYQVFCFHEKNIPVRRLGDPIPATGVLLLSKGFAEQEETLLYLKKNLGNYGLLIVLAMEPGLTLRLDYTNLQKTMDMSQQHGLSLVQALDEAIAPPLRAKLQERSLLNTVEPLITLTQENLQNELNTANIHKNVVLQMGSLIKREEAKTNINDVINQAKNMLQLWNTDIEKTFKIKYEELNKANTGRYSLHLKSWTDELKNLKRTEIAEKTEKLEATVEPKFMREFEARIRTEIDQDFSSDYNIMLSSIDSLLNKLNLVLSDKGITEKDQNNLEVDYSRFPNPDYSLRSNMGFNRTYTGELVKEGAMEYFIALKEYTGSMMVAIGLLAPLNMLASASSAEAQQNGGKHTVMTMIAEVFKQLRIGIQALSAVVILAMIIWGFVDLRKRIPRKRKEELDREVKKAKDILLSEGKRMYGDASKDWVNSVSTWLREASSQLSSQLDKAMRSYTQAQQQKVSENKSRIERQKLGVDNMILRINSAEKNLAEAQRLFKSGHSDLEKDIRNIKIA